jgi:RNA-binding protein
MPALQLTPAERKHLRGDAHHLDPVVLIGNDGLTVGVLKEADAALKAHGLIKVRVHGDDRAAREALLRDLAERLSAAPVQHIGKLLVLWRPIPEKAAPVEAPVRGRGVRVVTIVKPAKSPTHRPKVKKIKLPGNLRVTSGGSIKRARVRKTSVKKQQVD